MPENKTRPRPTRPATPPKGQEPGDAARREQESQQQQQ